MTLTPAEQRNAALNAVMGVEKCPGCARRPVKWVGRQRPLCLVCFADERLKWERQQISLGRAISGSCVGPECLGCGSSDVDADGRTWWCNGCGMETGLPKRRY